MTDEQRLKLLEEMREAFRKARPDLELPPARRGGAQAEKPKQLQQPQPQLPAKTVQKQESERSDEVQRKLQALRETGRQQPSTIVGMLKKFIGRSGKR